MLISYSWLKELLNLDGVSPEEAAERLTLIGLEVEGVTEIGRKLENVVVADVVTSGPHPSRPNLKVVTVNRGGGTVDVVCGAPNVPKPGGKVALALPGARLEGGTVEARPLGGVMSAGMLSSEKELGIGEDASGLFIIDEPIPSGTPLLKAFPIADTVLEVSITPNRGDCLSHRGIARELAASLERPFDPPSPSSFTEEGKPASDSVKVRIDDPDGCPRYMAGVVLGVTVGPSPFALRHRLHILGQRPINNIVDATNLLLLEFGQPFHAFDLGRLQGGEIIVRRAQKGETMKTLDGADRVLTPEDLVIADARAAVAVAGVMGGLASEVSEATRNLLLECATFQPRSIRRTSKRLRLASESSMRFERGVDQEGMPLALRSLTSLVCRLSGGRAAPRPVDSEPRPFSRPKVFLRPERYRKVVGMEAGARDLVAALGRLGLEAGTDPNERLAVAVPSRRPDLRREEDLIEEVIRVLGYDRIPSTPPRIASSVPSPTQFQEIRRAREILASLGLFEAINYTFAPEKDLATLHEQARIRIANPLKEDRAHMRTTLLAGLIEDLKRAINRRVEPMKLFEVGPTFRERPGETFPEEPCKVSALLWGKRDVWVGDKESALDFYDLKGLAEAFVREFCGRSAGFELRADPRLHPRSACAVLVDGTSVGVLGEIHPEIGETLDLPAGVFVFELDLALLLKGREKRTYFPLPRFPAIVRDVALLLDERATAAEVMAVLRHGAGPLAVQVDVFDVYKGKQVQKGRKSMAFRVTYRADDRTLTDLEVDEAHQRAVQEALAAFEAVQR